MEFSEKLDFLMTITKTTNSALARYTSLDPSYISRLRNGSRIPVDSSGYLNAMADYFSRHCGDSMKKAAISDILGNPSVKTYAPGKLSACIYQWLLHQPKDENPQIEGFLQNLSHLDLKKPPVPVIGAEDSLPEGSPVSAEVFYGTEGKREAVIAFLMKVIAQPVPRILYLYSDEELSWLSGNREFLVRWAALLSLTIQKGNKIKIIHTVSRNIDEMMTAISEWLPIYMSGAIEPYYYPRLRDGIYKRTLFLAPDTAAVTSHSIADRTSGKVNLLLTDPPAIQALVKEFNDYLYLCRPLMQIFTPASKDQYFKVLSEFEREAADAIINNESLPLSVMPEDVALCVLARSALSEAEKAHILEFYKIRETAFRENSKKNRFYHIIRLADPDSLQNPGIRIPFSDMLTSGNIVYTPAEYKLHIDHIISLLETCEHFEVYIANEKEYEGYMLYVKEGVGVLVAIAAAPSVIFAINESNMTSGFWDYLSKKTTAGQVNRKETIAKLKSYSEQLGCRIQSKHVETVSKNKS